MGTPIFKICGEDVNVDQAIADALGSSGAFVSVATPALLSTVDDAPMADGAYAWTVSNRVPFYLDKNSGAPPVDNVVIATLSGTGRWIRDLGYNDQLWLNQSTWFIDSVVGDDTLSGRLLITPIKTIAEWYRRTGGQLTSVNTTINLLGLTTWPSTDPFNYSVLPVGGNRTLIVIGVLTVVRSGSINSAGLANPPMNSGNFISDGVSDWTADVGKIVRFANGNHAVVTKNFGMGSAGVSLFTNTAGAPLAAPITPMAYDVVEGMSIVFNARALEGGVTGNPGQGAAIRVQDLAISNQLRTWNPADIFARCRLPIGNDARYASGARFLGCSIGAFDAPIQAAQPGRFHIAGCGIFGDVNVLGSASMTYENNTMMGSTLSCGGAGFSTDTFEKLGGKLSITTGGVTTNGAGNGFFDSTPGPALDVTHGGVVRIANLSLYGSVNLGGLRARNGARVFIAAGYTPSITGGTQLDLPGGPNQVPPIPPSGVVAAAQPCNTFALWAAGLFLRTVTTQTENVGVYGTDL
jgi:hypothetical protein